MHSQNATSGRIRPCHGNHFLTIEAHVHRLGGQGRSSDSTQNSEDLLLFARLEHPDDRDIRRPYTGLSPSSGLLGSNFDITGNVHRRLSSSVILTASAASPTVRTETHPPRLNTANPPTTVPKIIKRSSLFNTAPTPTSEPVLTGRFSRCLPRRTTRRANPGSPRANRWQQEVRHKRLGNLYSGCPQHMRNRRRAVQRSISECIVGH